MPARIAPRTHRNSSVLADDASAWSLTAANVVSLGIAIAFHWDVAELMLVYWMQSVVIGMSYCARILSLDKFSTENFTINDRPVEPTPATKRQTAGFFAMHYGLFHAVYLGFIAADAPVGTLINPWTWAAGLSFAINHAYSYRYNRELDRRGTPNIGAMMFTPYVRILPMHIAIILGAMSASTVGLLLFGVLKTIADVVMHHVEHRVLRRTEAVAARAA